MASKAVAKVISGNVVPISQKYTLQSTGIWETLRRFLSIDPNRSNGVPLNPLHRNPSPGTLDPTTYHDPVTIPAGDIAGNPYWKRDHRRAYPRLSVVTQPDVVGLLEVGSAAKPRVELIGEAGGKMLVAAKEKAQGGVAVFLTEKGLDRVKEDVFVEGLPPTPSGQKLGGEGKWEVYKYTIGENSYPEEYEVRSFQ